MNVNKYPKLYTVFEEYYQNNPKEINNGGTYGWTPLMFALSSKEMVKFLLSYGNGVDINCKNKFGSTALRCAAYHNHLDSGKLLCEYGADVHIKDCSINPIDVAISHYNYKFVQLLLEYDSNMNGEKCKDLVNNISLLNAKN